MSKRPPLLPTEALRRVLRTSRVDGTSMMLIAGVLALAAAASHDLAGTTVGLLVAGAGAVELHGSTLVGHAQPRGMRWLVASQLYLMLVIFGYVFFQSHHGGFDIINSHLSDDLIQQVATQQGISATQVRRELATELYFLIVLGTVLYQGGMTFYYLRRRPAVEAALQVGD
jgi:hypothetical protein